MDDVVVFEHPLIQHKISLLRDKNTGTNEFRQLVDEIAMLEGFEALSDLPVEDVEIETPIEKCMTPMIAGRKLAVVPILRAGLGMVSGILALVPSAKVGHIGMYRDEETHEPQEYYCKLPDPIEERTIVVCGNRWFCSGCDQSDQETWWQEYQVYVHYCCPGGTGAITQRASGYSDLCRSCRQTAQ